jgi:hypothetical protein
MMAHSRMHAKMSELLEDIPFFVNKCRDYSEVYARRNFLLQCIYDVYIDILTALEYMIRWYN